MLADHHSYPGGQKARGSVSSAVTAVDRDGKGLADIDVEAGPGSSEKILQTDATVKHNDCRESSADRDTRAEPASEPTWWREEVDTDKCTWLAVYALFLSGFTSCISFSVSLYSFI